MHILATEVRGLDEADAAIDLAQTPADLVVLSFSDTDLSVVAAAHAALGERAPTMRLASLKKLKHPMSVDLYVDAVIAPARAVIVRCLGGLDYWRYGLERIAAEARARGIVFVALPGCDRPDPRLTELSTVSTEDVQRFDRYFRQGGTENVANALRLVAARLGADVTAGNATDIGPATLFDAQGMTRAIDDLAVSASTTSTALVVFYRASLMAADTAPILALMTALAAEGLDTIGVAVTSLKDPSACKALERLMAKRPPAIILNTTAFSARRDDDTTILDGANVPVLQVILSGSTRDAWRMSARGLSPSDLAMNVVLPELDGRIVTRAVSFKSEDDRAAEFECALPRNSADPERCARVARQAARWVRLASQPRAQRRIAIMLSDYPARGGRAGYAVGLDTAASAAAIVEDLARCGFDTGGAQLTSADIEALLRGETERLRLNLDTYASAVARLPADLQTSLQATWGPADADPCVMSAAFSYPMLQAGNVSIFLQPDRGALGDAKSGYHDQSVPPRHSYVALYLALQTSLVVDAMIHLGTHGTLEWLPGKALALSADCWPDLLAGALPVIYPFIVNNPGEAAQAKRRISAVTIGHLTPPPSRAGLHGPLAELEPLVDEYAEADGMDRRRIALLEAEILERARASGLSAECGISASDTPRAAIQKLDAQLCDIKDLSVREGLHVFGRQPTDANGRALRDAIASAVPGGLDDMAKADVAGAIASSASSEMANLIAALDGRRVAPGPSGSPSRGRIDVLPTGRNLTTLDPRAIPTRTATAIGTRAAAEVVRRYLQDHGDYPRALVMDLWASASLRTGGDDIAQALAYLGARPVWDAASNRATGIEILPLASLGRPRIAVTLRVSGLFRDLFEAQIALFDLAVERVSARDEDDADNPLAASRRRDGAVPRVFASAPGTFGAAAAATALDTAWRDQAALGSAYLDAVTQALDGAATSRDARADFARRIGEADALVHVQDDSERDLLDGDGVADFAGGFAAAAAMLGAHPALYHLDTSRPDAPKARTFAEDVARIVRGRLTNPKWIAGMLAHGHRGAGEIAQSVDALYAFAATANIVPHHLFDATHDALIADDDVLARLIASNPDAVRAIVARLQDLRARDLWHSRRNATARELDAAMQRATFPKAAHVEAAQ
ncbi:MAG: cobaltochelatase subunit CobN [Hyphomicrobium sp.]